MHSLVDRDIQVLGNCHTGHARLFTYLPRYPGTEELDKGSVLLLSCYTYMAGLCLLGKGSVLLQRHHTHPHHDDRNTISTIIWVIHRAGSSFKLTIL